MSFKMIKEAQTLSTLSTSRRKALEDVKKAAGLGSIVEAHELVGEAFGARITPEDYDEWINQAVQHAHELGLNINRRGHFNDALGEVLENDPAGKVNPGDDELSKYVFDAAWKRYQHIKNHLKATNVMQAREDEEALCRAMDARAAAVEDEEYEELNVDEPSSMDTQYKGDMEAEMGGDEDLPPLEDEMPDGDVDGEMPAEGAEGAELAKCDLEGFEAGLQTLEGGEADASSDCPYEEGTEECEAWVAGYERAMSYGEDDSEMDAPADDMSGDEFGDEAPMDAEADMDAPAYDTGREDSVMTRGAENEEDHRGRGYRAAKREYHGGYKVAAKKHHPEWERGYEEFMSDTEGQRDLQRKLVKQGAEDEEKLTLKSILSAPRENLSKAVKDMESDGAHAFFTTKMPRNPHSAKSLAHKAWAKGFKNAAKDSFGFAPKPTDGKSKAKAKPKKR